MILVHKTLNLIYEKNVPKDYPVQDFQKLIKDSEVPAGAKTTYDLLSDMASKKSIAIAELKHSLKKFWEDNELEKETNEQLVELSEAVRLITIAFSLDLGPSIFLEALKRFPATVMNVDTAEFKAKHIANFEAAVQAQAEAIEARVFIQV
jgi:hypothetical protein